MSCSTPENQTIWTKMIAVRQLSMTYYTISTCLSDLLHRYIERNTTQHQNISSSSTLLENLRQTLFSSSSSTSNPSHDQSKLIADYALILQTILQQNTIHTNIIQNIRRLFRSDSLLKQLFTTESNEYCQCQECDCTTSNSINDVIHDVGEIRSRLLIDSCSIPCTCFRCGDQSQQKTITFQKFSSCLALIVNQLDIRTLDSLTTTTQGVTYDLIYIIQLDNILRSIISVYQRDNDGFVQVDGMHPGERISSFKANGKFLTLWLNQSNLNSHTTTQVDSLLSPPQSTSSVHHPTTHSITTDIVNTEQLLEVPTENDDEFWNSLTQSTTTTNTTTSTTTTENNNRSNSMNDSVSDLYLTLLHSTTNKTSPIKSRSEHDRTVNTLATDVLWPLIMDQTNRRTSKKSTSSTTTTIGSPSSVSSVSTGSLQRRHNSFKQLSSTIKSRRVHPYSTST